MKIYQILKYLLNSLGYIDNSVKVKKEKYSDNRINLVFEISEGPRYKITDVKFYGNSTFSDKYLYSKINTKTLSLIIFLSLVQIL